MKVLVTGGNGFIGRHIVKELHTRGMKVISLDIVPPPVRLPGVSYVDDTIMDKYSLSSYMRGCDAMFHLAAMLGVKRSDKQLLKCLNVNIQGTVNALEACRMSAVPYFLFTSSSEIYGDVSQDRVSEESPLNPKSVYAISKLAGEQYVKAFHREYGMEYNIVRFFNIYGPGQVAEFVIPRFIKMVEKGIAPTLYGDGKQIRSFCNTRDSSRAVVDIFAANNLRNETFNVGNDLEPISMADLAARIVKQSDSNLTPEYVPFAESDRHSTREIYYRLPDISKVKKAIGYEPKVMLEEGLGEMIRSGDIEDSWADPIS